MYMTIAEKRKKSRRIWTLIILSVLIFCTFTYSVNAGYSKLPFLEVIKSFFGMADAGTQLIVTEFRLPRIVIALLVGAGLAVSGTILQGISGNGLADPGILGINNGAGLAVMLYISFFSFHYGRSSVIYAFYRIYRSHFNRVCCVWTFL